MVAPQEYVNSYSICRSTGLVLCSNESFPPFRLYTILSLPKLYGMYCNKGWSGGNTVLRNSVGDEGRGWGAQTKEVFANNRIDSCTKASSQTILL